MFISPYKSESVLSAGDASNPNDSWWVGVPCESFGSRCKQEQHRMRNSRFGLMPDYNTTDSTVRFAQEKRQDKAA